MKVLNLLLSKLLSLVVLCSGVALIVLWVREDQLPFVVSIISDAVRQNIALLLLGVGGLLTLLGLLGILPRRLKDGQVKTISYPGTCGDVIIELDSVEANLNRVIGKMAEVKWISVSVFPDEDHSKARISADIKLVKKADETAREAANRVSDCLSETAANLLGVEDVTRVDLIVKGISVMGSSAKPAGANADEAGKRSDSSDEKDPGRDGGTSLQSPWGGARSHGESEGETEERRDDV
ncbi:MAG TPA: hypothetical protein PLO37_08105 [Candidatus Hydrogenedentes bacterium]|nr:hypothetical protein [Candidatus Hydrogenedentota bacterium]HPG66794.1 hypothetical protein [Candidatus Hydrogenedentota bacterium]